MAQQLTPDGIMQLGLGFWASKTLLSAIELGVFTELAKSPADAEKLRQKVGIAERSSADFFDSLVSLGMLERENGVYRNTPETDLFLDKAKPTYAAGMLEMANARLYPFWGSLTTGLKTGAPQNEAQNGENFFAKLYQDPAGLKIFLEGMTGISMGAAIAISEKFPWANYKTFVDVGAAQGALPVQVARTHSHLTGTNFDLPPVGPVFDEFTSRFQLQDRLSFQPGDFFKDDLPKADVVVMGHILHDWDLDEKRMLTKKAYDALPEGGAFIVYEALIDDDRSKNAFGLLMSLNMLIETPGGFDYTGADCSAWMKDAGFKETRVEHLVGPDSMVVGIK